MYLIVVKWLLGLACIGLGSDTLYLHRTIKHKLLLTICILIFVRRGMKKVYCM